MATESRERRTIDAPPAFVESRADGDGPRIVGHAAVFGVWTTLYSSRTYRWLERINAGAFASAVRERQDVRCLFNHDPNWLLGRTRSGTLTLAEDSTGLAYECIPPRTRIIDDLVLAPMRRGDLSQSSFAFRVRPGGERVTIREEDGVLIEERELIDLDLYDVSPVTYPAYAETDCALRSIAEDRERRLCARRPGEAARRAMAARLVC